MLELVILCVSISCISGIFGIIYSNIEGILEIIFLILSFVGVIIHELSHLVFHLLTGIPANSLKIHFRDENGDIHPHGSVGMSREAFYRASFIQHTLMSLGPIIVASLLVLFLIEVLNTFILPSIIIFLIYFLIISIFIGANPSPQDLKLNHAAFIKNPKDSIYQIFLVILSQIIIWFIFSGIRFVLPFQVLYYILDFLLISLFYFFWKRFFKGIKNLIIK